MADRDTADHVRHPRSATRCSTDEQDLTAQRERLAELGVAAERMYLDHGLGGTTRTRSGLDQSLAVVRTGDTLVVPKLDRLARSVQDAPAIGDDRTELFSASRPTIYRTLQRGQSPRTG